MQITDITVLIHEHAWRHPIVAPTGTQQLGVLTIETDEGLSGNSFVSGAAGEAITQIIKLIKPMLIGRNPSDIGSIWSDMWARNRILLPMAMGAIDIALWDIMGKAANLPVYQLLGAYKSQVPAYFSSFQHASPSDFADEALYWKGQGWARLQAASSNAAATYGRDGSGSRRRRGMQSYSCCCGQRHVSHARRRV